MINPNDATDKQTDSGKNKNAFKHFTLVNLSIFIYKPGNENHQEGDADAEGPSTRKLLELQCCLAGFDEVCFREIFGVELAIHIIIISEGEHHKGGGDGTKVHGVRTYFGQYPNEERNHDDADEAFDNDVSAQRVGLLLHRVTNQAFVDYCFPLQLLGEEFELHFHFLQFLRVNRVIHNGQGFSG